jgi:hypothetical protein
MDKNPLPLRHLQFAQEPAGDMIQFLPVVLGYGHLKAGEEQKGSQKRFLESHDDKMLSISFTLQW